MQGRPSPARSPGGASRLLRGSRISQRPLRGPDNRPGTHRAPQDRIRKNSVSGNRKNFLRKSEVSVPGGMQARDPSIHSTSIHWPSSSMRSAVLGTGGWEREHETHPVCRNPHSRDAEGAKQTRVRPARPCEGVGAWRRKERHCHEGGSGYTWAATRGAERWPSRCEAGFYLLCAPQGLILRAYRASQAPCSPCPGPP